MTKSTSIALLCALLALTLAACKVNRFVGTWTAVENQRNVVAKTLEIKKDGTWRLTTVYGNEFKGTHKIVGDLLQMTDDNATRPNTVATMESDRRLKLMEVTKPPVYFKQ